MTMYIHFHKVTSIKIEPTVMWSDDLKRNTAYYTIEGENASGERVEVTLYGVNGQLPEVVLNKSKLVRDILDQKERVS